MTAMTSMLRSLARPLCWLLLLGYLLPGVSMVLDGRAQTGLEFPVCSAAGMPIPGTDGEPGEERPVGAGHCIFCPAPHCAPPSAVPALVLACAGSPPPDTAYRDATHLPDPPAWLKAPVRAPPVSGY